MMTMKTFRLFLASCALAATGSLLPAQVPEPALTAAAGFDYSRGDYGFTTDTEVFSLPLDLGYESVSAFSAMFRRAAGASPSHYRHRPQTG